MLYEHSSPYQKDKAQDNIATNTKFSLDDRHTGIGIDLHMLERLNNRNGHSKNMDENYITSKIKSCNQWLNKLLCPCYFSLHHNVYIHQLLLAYKLSPRLQSFRAFVIVASCVDVIVEAYMDPSGSSLTFLLIDTIISMFFLFDFILNLLTTPKPTKYLCSLYGLIDIISVLPLFLSILLVVYNYIQYGYILSESAATEDTFDITIFYAREYLRLFRSMKILELTQFSIIKRILAFNLSNTNEVHDWWIERRIRLIQLAFKILVLIYIFTGLVWILQHGSIIEFNEKMQWHDSMYYVVVTMSTVGYGDVTPSAYWLSRVLIMILILTSLILVPNFAGSLFELVTQGSRYTSAARVPAGSRLILLVGSVSYTALQDFLAELWHTDHGEMTNLLHVVILSPDEPSPRLSLLLEQNQYRGRLQYIWGNPLDYKDLSKAEAHKATAIFLLSCRDAITSDAKAAEERLVIYGMAVLKYVERIEYSNNYRMLHLKSSMPFYSKYLDYTSLNNRLQARNQQHIDQRSKDTHLSDIENDEKERQTAHFPNYMNGDPTGRGNTNTSTIDVTKYNFDYFITKKKKKPIVTLARVISSTAERQLQDLGFAHVIGTNDIKMRILAYGTLFPGFIAIFANLVRSNPVQYDRGQTNSIGFYENKKELVTAQDSTSHEGQPFSIVQPPSVLNEDLWKDHYIQGSDFSIYNVTVQVDVNSKLRGKPFHYVAIALYYFDQTLMIGVKIGDTIVVNPGKEFVFEPDTYEIYCIALDQSEAIRAVNHVNRSLEDIDAGLYYEDIMDVNEDFFDIREEESEIKTNENLKLGGYHLSSHEGIDYVDLHDISDKIQSNEQVKRFLSTYENLNEEDAEIKDNSNMMQEEVNDDNEKVVSSHENVSFSTISNSLSEPESNLLLKESTYHHSEVNFVDENTNKNVANKTNLSNEKDTTVSIELVNDIQIKANKLLKTLHEAPPNLSDMQRQGKSFSIHKSNSNQKDDVTGEDQEINKDLAYDERYYNAISRLKDTETVSLLPTNKQIDQLYKLSYVCHEGLKLYINITSSLPPTVRKHVVVCNCWSEASTILRLYHYFVTLRRSCQDPIVVLSNDEEPFKELMTMLKKQQIIDSEEQEYEEEYEAALLNGNLGPLFEDDLEGSSHNNSIPSLNNSEDNQKNKKNHKNSKKLNRRVPGSHRKKKDNMKLKNLYFEDIFFVHGSPMNVDDLMKCNVKKARAVVLIGREHYDIYGERDSPMADRCTLLSSITLDSVLETQLDQEHNENYYYPTRKDLFQNHRPETPHTRTIDPIISSIKAVNTNVFILVDLQSESSVPHLRQGDFFSSDSTINHYYTNSDTFNNSGVGFDSESSIQLSQSLTAHTKSGFGKFWNGHKSDASNFNMKTASELHLQQNQHMMDWPVFASGRVFTSSLLDVLPVHIFYNPSSPEILDKLIGARGDSELNHIIIRSAVPVTNNDSSHFDDRGSVFMEQRSRSYTEKALYPGYIDMLPVPDHLFEQCLRKCCKYSNIFDYFSTKGILPLGLYRPENCFGAPLPYAHLNPGQDLIMDPYDFIYVIMPCRKVKSAPKKGASSKAKRTKSKKSKKKSDQKTDKDSKDKGLRARTKKSNGEK